MAKTIFYSFALLICKILFSPLEDKIHIFASPCNILSLYIYSILHGGAKIWILSSSDESNILRMSTANE